jgi:hypothetical protein
MLCMFQAFKLWMAAGEGDLEMARSLLNDKADVNARDPTRFQPCTATDVEVASLAIPPCCIIPTLVNAMSSPKQPKTSECVSIYHLPLRFRCALLPSPIELPFTNLCPVPFVLAVHAGNGSSQGGAPGARRPGYSAPGVRC